MNENEFNGYSNWETYIVAKDLDFDVIKYDYCEEHGNLDGIDSFIEPYVCGSVWRCITDKGECSNMVKNVIEDFLEKVDFDEIVRKNLW